MFIGAFADWRNGMEEYARANTLVQPMRKTWKRGTPFGWQSWGVMSDRNGYDVDVAVSGILQGDIETERILQQPRHQHHEYRCLGWHEQRATHQVHGSGEEERSGAWLVRHAFLFVVERRHVV